MSNEGIGRRDFLRASFGLAAAAALAPSLVRGAAAATSTGGHGYGPLAAVPDANGLLLPKGFTSRIVARAGDVMPGLGYRWHTDPDGAAVFPMPDGGWVYASNQEERLDNTAGGAAALRFAPDGAVVDAYRILDGTSTNCAGGPTPWGTWLSCEEHPLGRVWECDPTQPGRGVARPALGTFWHEAVTVDPVRERLYLTEDAWNGQDGRFYRFTPAAYPDLSAGVLEAAKVADDWAVSWVPVDTTAPVTAATTRAATVFRGAEGVWYDDGVVYFTTKTDNRVWAYQVATSTLRVHYDAAVLAEPPLTGVDNVVVSPAGELFVAEDGGNMELVVLTLGGVADPFLRVIGHDDSELAGPAFDPSGTRLYFSSMRGSAGRLSTDGVVYEVRGPFGATRQAQPSTRASTGVTATTGAAASSAGTAALPATGGGGPGALGLALLGAAAAGVALARAYDADERGGESETRTEGLA